MSTVNQTTVLEQQTKYLQALLDAAQPEIYRQNAFRLAELGVEATPRELSRRQQIIEQASAIGASSPAGSGRALPLATASAPDLLRAALQRLRDPEERLLNEFFWFWPQQPGAKADEALTALARGDVDAALTFWSKQQTSGEAGVATHNLAVLAHAQALDLETSASLSADEEAQRDEYWQTAFTHWRTLLTLPAFWQRLDERIQALDDPRLNHETGEQLRATLPLALLLINARLAIRAAERNPAAVKSARWRNILIRPRVTPAVELNATTVRHIDLIDDSGFAVELVDEALRRTTEPLRNRIQSLCKHTQNQTLVAPAHADTAIRQLLTQTRLPLALFDHCFSVAHPLAESIHDEVASTVSGGAIAYANHTRAWANANTLLQAAQSIAVSGSTQAYIQKNLNILEGNLAAEEPMCWYCQRNRAEERVAYEQKLYGDVQRNGRQVTWRSLTVRVPRCRTCQDAHNQIDGYMLTGGLMGALVGAPIGALIFGAADGNWVFAGIGFVIVIGLLSSIARRIGIARVARQQTTPATLVLEPANRQWHRLAPAPAQPDNTLLNLTPTAVNHNHYTLNGTHPVRGKNAGATTGKWHTLHKPRTYALKTQDDVEAFPLINQLLTQGWSLGEKPST